MNGYSYRAASQRSKRTSLVILVKTAPLLSTSFSTTTTSTPNHCSLQVHHVLLQHHLSLAAAPAKPLHALLTTTGATLSSLLSNNTILSAYSKAGDISSARQLFDKMPQRNTVSYNTLLAAYYRHCCPAEASSLLFQMRTSGFTPTQFTLGAILASPSCGPLLGCQLHPLIVKLGLLHADAFSGTALLGMFLRHGCLDRALEVFEDMPLRTVVTWNAVIGGVSRLGLVQESMSLFRWLLRTGLQLSEVSFLSVLSGFQLQADCESGGHIHGLTIKYGMDYYSPVSNALIDMYANCSDFSAAQRMFFALPNADIVSWNTMIMAFAKSEEPMKALDLFFTMSFNGFLPTQSTFVSIVGALADYKLLGYGKHLHAKIIKVGFGSDVFVGSALIDLYSKCDTLQDALSCFDVLSERNIVSWNALISAYLMEGSRSPIYLLQEMLYSCFRPNEFSFSSLLKSCLVGELGQLHSLIIRMGYELDEYVSSSLMAAYAANGLFSDAMKLAESSIRPLSLIHSNIVARIYNRSGQFERAKSVLTQLEDLDMVSWNTMIESCTRNRDYGEAFELFKHMLTAKVLPDNCTFVSLLSICTKLCNLALGSAIHGIIIKLDFSCCDVLVCNVLLDMYAKCGNLSSSINIFGKIAEKNVASWTMLISALGLHGHAHEALLKFKEMQVIGFKPDRVALLAVLSACRHGGLVEEGLRVFEQMKGVCGFEPEMDHYACIIDLLCRNGQVEHAKEVISSMPFRPNALIWRTLLNAAAQSEHLHEQQTGVETQSCL